MVDIITRPKYMNASAIQYLQYDLLQSKSLVKPVLLPSFTVQFYNWFLISNRR